MASLIHLPYAPRPLHACPCPGPGPHRHRNRAVCTCKVTFTYEATQPDELELKVGEMITGVDISVEGGW